jgi:hypothetical protein
MSYVVAFCRFWYDFIVGDDWTVALTVVVGVAATYALAHQGHGGTAWWILPIVMAGTLGLSIMRARRSRG